jgi:hypothetical protein
MDDDDIIDRLWEDYGKATASELKERIAKILAGKHPGIQGVVLAELLALWVVGHPDVMRETLLNFHIKAVRELIPTVEAEMRAREAEGGRDDTR